MRDMNKENELRKAIEFNLDALERGIINNEDFIQAIEEIHDHLNK